MATDERTLGNLEGRMAEQSALLHQLHADLTTGLRQVNTDLTAGLQQVNGRIDQVNSDLAAGFQQVNSDLATGLHLVNGRVDQVNARIDRLMLAMLAIGGGQFAALIGVIVALVVRGG